jgi:TPR repeat protein
MILEFSEAEEEYPRAHLLAVWNKGKGDVYAVNAMLGGLSHRMRSNPEIARYHLDSVIEIADSNIPVPEAHLILVDCYRRGHGTKANPSEAFRYLQAAYKVGGNKVRWWYANYLLDNNGFEGFLDRDPIQALDIFREIAWDDNDTSMISLARWSAVPLLIEGKHSGQLSTRDEKLIKMYIEDWRSMSVHHYYTLARFYSDGIDSRDYSGPEYNTARELLTRGADQSSIPTIRNQCRDLIAEWGLTPKPVQPATMTEKVVEGAKVTIGLGYVLIVLVIWSVIGVVLLAITAWIGLYVGLPLIAIVVIGGWIASLRR